MRELSEHGIAGLPGLFGSRAVVVVFGDSLTQRGFEPNGWAAALAAYYGRRADVLNRGYGGYNSRHGKHIMHALFPAMPNTDSVRRGKYLLVTLWFGTNDASSEEHRAHVPIAEYEANMEAMVVHLQRIFHFVVLLSPPPVHSPTRIAFQKATYGDRAYVTPQQSTERAALYGAIAKRVADRYSVLFIDVLHLMLDQGHAVWPRFVGAGQPGGDGLHLSSEGQEFVAKQVIELIEASSIKIENLPMELPFGAALEGQSFDAVMDIHQRSIEDNKIGLGESFLLPQKDNTIGAMIETPSELIIICSISAMVLFLLIFRYVFSRGPANKKTIIVGTSIRHQNL